MRTVRYPFLLGLFIFGLFYYSDVILGSQPLFADSKSRTTNYRHSMDAESRKLDRPIRKLVMKTREKRAKAVKAAYGFAWNGYSKHAFGHDEVHPVSGTAGDTRNGLGATIVDAMSTAILMGLDDIVQKQVQYCLTIDWNQSSGSANTFETTIRYLGGLISAADLIDAGYTNPSHATSSQLLVKARELADAMLPMFETKTGIAALWIELGSKATPAGGSSSVATAGTLLLEWTRLSDLLNERKYGDLAYKAYPYFLEPRPEVANVWPGLVPTWISTTDGTFQTPYSGGWGGESDSYYEYLIKISIYDPKLMPTLGKSWIDAVNSTMHHLSTPSQGLSNFTLVGTFSNLTPEKRGSKEAVQRRSGHLDCFIGGNIILGSSYAPLHLRQEFLAYGLSVTDGCHYAAAATKLGITPEGFGWDEVDSASAASTKTPDIYVTDARWALRPEVAESYFYAYRATHNPKYQDWAWGIFQVLEKHCKAKYGYAALANVDVEDQHVQQIDSQESFLFAETLKYLYLIFASEDILDLKEFVFNTEGHPIRIKAS